MKKKPISKHRGSFYKVGSGGMFLVVLGFVLWFILSLYRKNFADIVNGTYVYDRFETPWMLSPFLIIFMFFLFVVSRRLDKRKKKKEGKD
jgi:hypothetical protein